MKKIIYYLARFLTILIVAFFAVFILEGFSPSFSWQDSVSHLITSLVVLGISLLAWKKPLIGCWFFILIGAYYLYSTIARQQRLDAYVIALVPLITGILFLIEGIMTRLSHRRF